MSQSLATRSPSVVELESVAFDFYYVSHGVWIYRDAVQLTVAAAVHATLAWDIQGFDAWLFGTDHWSGYPRVRQRLIEARRQLNRAWLDSTPLESQRALDIKRYFHTTRQLSVRLSNLPENLRQSMLSVLDYKATPASSKLDDRQLARIRRLYQEMIQSGQKYGAQTKLAKQYGVSLATIRKALLNSN